jgi:hypothetical protein
VGHELQKDINPGDLVRLVSSYRNISEAEETFLVITSFVAGSITRLEIMDSHGHRDVLPAYKFEKVTGDRKKL